LSRKRRKRGRGIQDDEDEKGNKRQNSQQSEKIAIAQRGREYTKTDNQMKYFHLSGNNTSAK